MKAIEARNIHRAYEQGKDVLRGVTFHVNQGEVVGLLGRNGAGKTTLLRIAMGMIEPQQGEIRVRGLDPRHDPVAVKRQVGYVSEDQSLPVFLTVRNVIELHRGLFPTWDFDLERQLRERFSIPIEMRVRSLSKGQARQVALLCAISHRPEILILDEPAGGLDPVARREFLETSIQLLNETGSAILFSSHYMSDVERLANRIVMLQGGRVLMDSDLDALREQYTLALIPSHDQALRDRINAIDGCMATRYLEGGTRAVFALDPELTRTRLLEAKLERVNCHTMRLEEMFVELMKGES